MSKVKKPRVRIKYSTRFLILVSENGNEYRVEPISATGNKFECVFDGSVIEFEIGKVGYVSKTGGIKIPDELYDMLVAYAELEIRTVFRGYVKNHKQKIREKNPQLSLFNN